MNRISIISLLILVSCAIDELDSLDRSEIIVVEGWITNQKKQHWIKLSETVPFNNTNSTNPIPDAAVSIQDNVGSYSLTHAGNGLYLTDSIAGIVARSYRVTVELENGDTIQSSWERLNPLMPIDTIRYNYFDDQDPDTGEDIKIYFPIVVSSDPVDENNFYRYKGFRNGSFLNEPNEIILLSDQFVNGATSLPNHIPEFRYTLMDTIHVELHSLSRSAFEFLELLKSQTTSLGSSSGTSPATLIGNLNYRNNDLQYVLGFFGASAVSIDSTIINQ